eukprot:jgi/Bigna1/83823/fgenesh1_pg.116_\
MAVRNCPTLLSPSASFSTVSDEEAQETRTCQGGMLEATCHGRRQHRLRQLALFKALLLLSVVVMVSLGIWSVAAVSVGELRRGAVRRASLLPCRLASYIRGGVRRARSTSFAAPNAHAGDSKSEPTESKPPPPQITLEQLKERIRLQQEAAKRAMMEVKSGATTLAGDKNDAELRHVLEGERAAIIDHSNYGIIEVTGRDRLDFLHGMSTNDIAALQPGAYVQTVFTTRTGRMIDSTVAIATEESVLLIVSPGNAATLSEMLDKYILASNVRVRDASYDYAVFRVLGSVDLRRIAPATPMGKAQENGEARVEFWTPGNGGDDSSGIQNAGGGKEEEIVAVHGETGGLVLPGMTLLVPTSSVAKVYAEIIKQREEEEEELLQIGLMGWEKLRVHQGVPKLGGEITESYNPLEAQLWDSLNFIKGCYIGQETIARLKTYKGVKQFLQRFRLDAMPDGFQTAEDGPENDRDGGEIIHSSEGGEKVGVLTSCAAIGGQIWGLGYVRTKANLEDGSRVVIGETEDAAGISAVMDTPLPRVGDNGFPEWLLQDDEAASPSQ